MRLNQVTVGSSDLDRSQEFYEAIGLLLIVKDDNYLRFECPRGESTFSVERVAAVPEAEQVTIYFESENVDADHARLVAAEIRFEHAPADMPWLWREARLRDPDGHPLCLFQGGDNRRYPPWRIGGRP